jgi:TPR repeat protein
MYYKGEGVVKDLNRAAGLFKRACDAGGSGGCQDLGLMYSRGEGVAKNLNRAADLFKRACDAGGSGGCLNLGSMYSRGQGVPWIGIVPPISSRKHVTCALTGDAKISSA